MGKKSSSYEDKALTSQHGNIGARESDEAPSPTKKPKPMVYDKEDDFDMLLKDFKNHKISASK